VEIEFHFLLLVRFFSPPYLHVLTFTVVYDRHFKGAKMETAAFTITSFRNYLHYHLKCCKSYLHTRYAAGGFLFFFFLSFLFSGMELVAYV
jgi:hypothetical protein